MFQKRKLNKKGFSLIEILIAIGILSLIVVPLAMNMVSSSQINSRAKQVAASSDISTSIMEIMQTVDLSDIITDVNGYDADEYGTPLAYTLTKTALGDYTIEKTGEYLLVDGVYKPVAKQEDVIQDNLVTSSINTRNTGDVTRAYFTGSDSGEYYFVLTDVETEELSVDVLAKIVPQQSSEMVNIVSMDQTEVIYVKQSDNMDMDVAAEFNKANDTYIALKGSVETIEDKNADWFYQNMERTIEVSIKQDVFSESATVVVEAIYTVDSESLREGDKTIKKTLGTFTTNSTSEFMRGVYVYYYPIPNDEINVKDHFIIHNQNELAAPVYLIAMDADSILEGLEYTPTLEVNELSDEVYTSEARTTVCSNIEDTNWQKTLYPTGRNLTVKSMGNTSTQQTLYSLEIEVYSHRDDSYEGGDFVPREKDLLVSTEGTFIDTSEVLDIASDKTTGLTDAPGIATAGKNIVVYNGEFQDGVEGTNVSWSGITSAKDAGTYEAKATPIPGYSWADGSTATKTYVWTIKRKPIAHAGAVNHEYSAATLTGVSGEYVTFDGAITGYDVGAYTAYATPTPNYAWEDGTYQTRSIKWKIEPRQLQIAWETGENKDTWTYDREAHSGSVVVSNILDEDIADIVLSFKNNSITDVGTITASVTGVNNKNYKLPTQGLEHQLTVVSSSSATYALKSNLIYNGELQSIVASSDGVYFEGTQEAKEAGKYELNIYLKEGYTWDPSIASDATQEFVTVEWEIAPKIVTLKWGTPTEWTYDGATHSTTCEVTNAIGSDNVKVVLTGNSIKDVGEVTVTAVDLSNDNYALPSVDVSCVLRVNPLGMATYQTYDFNYDGTVHVGVTGQFIQKSGTTSSSEVAFTEDGIVTTHKATVTPMKNYAWEGGGSDPIEVEWTIYPIKDAWYEWTNRGYLGSEIQGVYGHNTTYTGDIKGVGIGTYTAFLTPVTNHVWESDGTAKTIEVTWKIEDALYMQPVLKDTVFEYDGTYHSPALHTTTLNSGYTLSGDLEAKDVGVYTITASLIDPINTTWGDGSTNDVTLSWRITPKTVGISFDSNTWTYDKTEKTGTAKAINLASDTDVVNFTYSNNKRTNYGTQTFTITGLDNPNYQLPSTGLNGTMTINKREITINWGTYEWTYDGSQKTVSPTAGNVKSGDTVTLTCSNNKRTDAGSQTVSVDSLSNENYKLPATTTQKMTIHRSKTATASAKTGLVYNTKEQTGVSGSYVTWSGTTKATNAGDHTAYATPDSNHLWSDGTDTKKTVKWSIAKAAGSCTAPTAKTLNYTGSAQTLANAGSTSYGSMQYSLDGSSWSTSIPKGTNAGTYTVYYYSTGDANHEATSKSKSISVKINPLADATYSVSNKTYQSQKQADGTYAGVDQTAVTGTNVDITGTYHASMPGKYTAKVTPKANHAWADGSGTGTKDANWELFRAPWSSASGNTLVYTGSEQYGLTSSNIVIVSGTAYETDVGNYEVVVKPKDVCTWADTNTYENRTISWKITRNPSAYVSVANHDFDNSAHYGYSDKAYCSVSGDYKKTNASTSGKYYFTATAYDGYCFSDGKTVKEFGWYIYPATAKVSVKSSQKYTGGTLFGYSSFVGVDLEGTTSAKAVGSYNFNATPKTNYAWEGLIGSRSTKYYSWSITN